MPFHRYRKAIAAQVTGLIGWATAVVTSPPGPVTAAEWLFLATTVATAAGVYRVSNQTVAPTPTLATRARHQRGAVDPGSLALGVVLCLAVLWIVWVLTGSTPNP